jgi:hypothetical protein
MKRPTAVLCALGISALAAVALAQDSSSNQSTTTTKQTTTQVSPDGVTTKTTTIEGKVVRYEPGKTIVLVGPDNKEISYVLTEKVQAPADIQVGREVTLTAMPSTSGPAVITKITTTSITPEGNLKTETETRSTSSDPQAMSQSQSETTTKVTTITGTVSAYEPGKSVTFVLPDKKTVVYTIEPASVVPSDIAVGSTYTIETTTSGGTVVKKITTVKTTKKSTTVQP